ncbi:caspase family protein [Dyadobacter sp. CY323]|uniref:caspase family protein n=1 Tax=Dyadobacter sp. CY323 TaxID=2907302 RepID=UPI001F23919B|nr:caspase family protein [Dyadobacter sp. CY323]MCE6991058.1 caspase family protein [Dyadobacter sp. CY323]
MTMCNRPCCFPFEHFLFKSVVAGLFAVILISSGPKSCGQSYFYFANKLTLPGDPALNYHTLLTVHDNGSAVARIRYIEPTSQEDRTVEIQMLDSTSADSNGDQTHYLIRDGVPFPIQGIGISGFLSPRFAFIKQTEGNDIFFVPQSVTYQLPDGSWYLSEMIVNQQKTNVQLREETDLVSLFFKPSDEFYQYLFEIQPSYRAPAKRKEKLYLITVANTLDAIVGTSTRIDMTNVVNTFTQLAQDLNMDMVVQKIIDNDLNKQSVELALANLRPASIDIVVFYYSGHGFRKTKDRSEYPRMSLRINGKGDLEKNNLVLEDVYKILFRKKARVTLVLSDCCNEAIDAPPRTGPAPIRTRGLPGALKPPLNMPLCDQLLFPARPTAILIGSADKNQLAVGNPVLGGYFTNTFTVELRKTLYGAGKSTSWNGILASTKKQASWLSLGAECAPKVRCVQTARVRVIP